MKLKRGKYQKGKKNARDISFKERSDKTKISKVKSLKSKDPFYRRITRPLYTGGRKPFNTRTVVVTIEGGFTYKDRQQAKARGVDLPAEVFRSYYSDIDTIVSPRFVVDFMGESMDKFKEEFQEKYNTIIIRNVNVSYVYR